MRRYAFRSLVLALLLTTGLAWAHLDKTVTVEVDGELRTVRTYARTVGGVLDRAGLTVGAHDALAPAPDVAVGDGGRIVLRRARQLTLKLNGRQHTVWVTALSVEEALDQLGLRSAQGAFLSASRSRRIGLDGLAFEVRTPARVRILADGRERTIVTTAATVRDALREARVTLAHTDQVAPALTAYPGEGTAVRVTRVRGAHARETITIPFGVKRVPDAALYKGSTKVAVTGQSGIRERVYALTTRDGKVVARRLVVDRIARKPRTKVIRVGTKPRPFYMSRDTSSVDHLNWWALADCESHNNPRAIGGGGRYFGLYQFTLGTWQGVGGRGNPIDASREEQTYRAKLLYLRRGSAPWGYCGSRLYS